MSFLIVYITTNRGQALPKAFCIYYLIKFSQWDFDVKFIIIPIL